MTPQASFLILNRTAMHKLHLAENYLVVCLQKETAISGKCYVLDIRCQHNGIEWFEHRKRLPLAFAWDVDVCGDMMAALDNENLQVGQVGVWDLATGTQRLVLASHTSVLNCVLFPNPKTIITGAHDGALAVWDVPSGTCRHKLKEGDRTTENTKAITALKVHDNLLISGSRGGVVCIWDLNSGQTVHIFEGCNRSVTGFGFNTDHSLLATAISGGQIKIWNLISGTCIATCVGHTLVVNQLSTDPENERRLISAGADGWIHTWEWNTGAQVRSFWTGDDSATRNAIRGVLWTKELMVTGNVNGLLRAWDRQTNQARFDLRVRQGSVHQVAMRGNLLAIVAWLESGKHLIELYDISALDQEQSRFVNENQDLSDASLVMNLTF